MKLHPDKCYLVLSGSDVKTINVRNHTIKAALSGLRQFVTIESPLKMMKNAFYFILKALFVLKIFKFLP